MLWFLRRRGRVLPIQKALDRAEKVARRAARAPGPEAVTALEEDRKSTRLNSSHIQKSRMPSSA